MLLFRNTIKIKIGHATSFGSECDQQKSKFAWLVLYDIRETVFSKNESQHLN